MKTYLLTALVLIVTGCRKETVTQPDIVEKLLGRYRVTKVVSKSSLGINTTVPPYVAGIMAIERYNKDNTRIGLALSLSFGGPIGAPATEDPNKYLPDPQQFSLPLTQNGDITHFTDNLSAFGYYYKDTIVYRSIISNTWEQTITAVKQ